MVGTTKKRKKRPSGGLSSKEKLASKNPAARAEGRREISGKSSEQRQAAVAGAKELAGRKGFQGLAKQGQIREATQKEKDFTSKARRADAKRFPTQTQQATPIQAEKPSLDSATSTPVPAEDTEQPIVDPNALNQELVNQDLISQQIQRETEVPENFGRDVARTSGIAIGVGTLATGFILPAGGGVAAATTASKTIAAAGTGKLVKNSVQKGIATNSVNIARTTKFLTKAFSKTQTITSYNPTTGKYVTRIVTTSAAPSVAGVAALSSSVATTLVPIIGSYPFAGFLKEEALQTLGFAVSTAIKNEDLAGAEEALAEIDRLLNPDGWSAIIGAIPFANVQQQVNNYYDAAAVKRDIDADLVAKLRRQLESGEVEVPILRGLEEKRQDERRKRINEEFRQNVLENNRISDERRERIRKEFNRGELTDTEKEELARNLGGTSKKTTPSRGR